MIFATGSTYSQGTPPRIGWLLSWGVVIGLAISHTYLVGAVIVLILSPIALLTDRKSLKS